MCFNDKKEKRKRKKKSTMEPSRNGNFAGFPGHPPRPAPIGTGIGTWQLGMGRVQDFFKNPNQVRGEVRCSYNLTRPAPPRPEYKITTLPPTYKY